MWTKKKVKKHYKKMWSMFAEYFKLETDLDKFLKSIEKENNVKTSIKFKVSSYFSSGIDISGKHITLDISCSNKQKSVNQSKISLLRISLHELSHLYINLLLAVKGKKWCDYVYAEINKPNLYPAKNITTFKPLEEAICELLAYKVVSFHNITASPTCPYDNELVQRLYIEILNYTNKQLLNLIPIDEIKLKAHKQLLESEIKLLK